MVSWLFGLMVLGKGMYVCIQARKVRKVTRVMGWALSRQLRAPGLEFSMSAMSPLDLRSVGWAHQCGELNVVQRCFHMPFYSEDRDARELTTFGRRVKGVKGCSLKYLMEPINTQPTSPHNTSSSTFYSRATTSPTALYRLINTSIALLSLCRGTDKTWM